MADKRFNYKPIYPGFPWAITLRFPAATPIFPEGVRLRAQIRDEPGTTVLATITTESGHLERIDNERLAIRLDPAITKRLKADDVVLDLVRTDTPTPTHTGIRVTVQTKLSVTAPR